MKKCFVAMLAILSLFIMTGCGGGSPKKVAEKWLNAMMNGDVKAANAVSTAKTHEFNARAIERSKEDSESLEKIKKSKITYEEKIDGDKAIVTVTSDAEKEEMTITLVKQDGKWLVDVSID